MWFNMSAKHRKKCSHKSKSNSSSSPMNRDLSVNVQTPENETKFRVKFSKNMGRYMVAMKDVQPGEVVLSELPLVVGPCTGAKVQCLGCYKNLEDAESYVSCLGCGWPLCSGDCAGLKIPLGHTHLECAILRESKSSSFFDSNDITSIRPHMQAVVPLRCLLLKCSDPSAFGALLDMEHHNDIRRNIPEVWSSNQENVVDRLIKDWALTEFTEEEVHTICGVLEVNCFEIGQDGLNIRGLFPTAFLMSHNCVPNTNHVDDTTYRLTVRASTVIPSGYPVTMSYAYTLQNTLKRREHLLENKFFECHCRRCCDPTELGSYSGALICPKCEKGLVLPKFPLDPESTWICNNSSELCPGYTVLARSMKLLLNRITQEVEDMDFDNVETMENFLDKYRNVLHPAHYLCLGVKVALSQLYGKINGFLLYQLSEELLERKQELCEEILEICDKIEPGYTRIRGVTLYAIHEPMLMLLTRKLSDHSMSRSKIKSTLRTVVKYLTEAGIILGYEPKDSPEGLLGKAAAAALVKIRDWEKIVGRI